MIELTAERLFVYPVKSCAGVERETLSLSPVVGVEGDRVMALAIDEVPDAGDGAFRFKTNFLHGMRWPEVVRLRPEILEEQGGANARFFLRSEGEERAIDPADAAEVARGLAKGAPEPRLAAARSGGTFADRDAPLVSIINLDTLEAFADYAGDAALANPLRWRANVYLRAGIGAEYAWAREKAALRIGGAAVTVRELLGRCAMITAEPTLGRVDHPDLMQALWSFEKTFGFEHPEERAPVMGVLATPHEPAVARRG